MPRPKELLEETIKKHRTLSLHGFRGRNYAEYAKMAGSEFQKDRENMVNRLEAFSQCLRFLRRIHRQRDFNFRFSTYVLKHFVEYAAVQKGMSVYVPEGIFIAAAYASGFKVKRLEHSGFLNAQINYGPKGFDIYSGRTKLLVTFPSPLRIAD
jgi:hypothetical protein